MKLADLRKLTIRDQSRIHFRLRNGMQCVITEHGVAQVPALKGIPDFNLEEELAAAGDFLIEPAVPGTKKDKRPSARPRPVARQELAQMLSAPAGTDTSPHSEEE